MPKGSPPSSSQQDWSSVLRAQVAAAAHQPGWGLRHMPGCVARSVGTQSSGPESAYNSSAMPLPYAKGLVPTCVHRVASL